MANPDLDKYLGMLGVQVDVLARSVAKHGGPTTDEALALAQTITAICAVLREKREKYEEPDFVICESCGQDVKLYLKTLPLGAKDD